MVNPEPSEERPKNASIPFEFDPARVEESFAKLKRQLSAWAKKGRYSKVRIKFRGKQILPDLPLAAAIAVEGATFYWSGLFRTLLLNIAGKSFLEVELVNDSGALIQEARAAILSGDLAVALRLLDRAAAIDERNAEVHLQRGVARKLHGDRSGARESFTHAIELQPDGVSGREAQRLLRNLAEEEAIVRSST